MTNGIFLDSEEFKARINQLGQVEIYCSAEFQKKFADLVIAVQLTQQEHQEAVVKLANQVNQRFESLLLDLGQQIRNLKINEPSSESPSDFSCNWRALRRKQLHHAQQQLQQAKHATGKNNRQWVMRRKRNR